MSPKTHGITLEPGDLSLLGTAFDDAWAAVAPEFTLSEEPQVARARIELARIMLKLMELHQLDGEELKRTGVRLFKENASCALA
jgi:hypothetical protein